MCCRRLDTSKICKTQKFHRFSARCTRLSSDPTGNYTKPDNRRPADNSNAHSTTLGKKIYTSDFQSVKTVWRWRGGGGVGDGSGGRRRRRGGGWAFQGKCAFAVSIRRLATTRGTWHGHPYYSPPPPPPPWPRPRRPLRGRPTGPSRSVLFSKKKKKIRNGKRIKKKYNLKCGSTANSKIKKKN